MIYVSIACQGSRIPHSLLCTSGVIFGGIDHRPYCLVSAGLHQGYERDGPLWLPAGHIRCSKPSPTSYDTEKDHRSVFQTAARRCNTQHDDPRSSRGMFPSWASASFPPGPPERNGSLSKLGLSAAELPPVSMTPIPLIVPLLP